MRRSEKAAQLLFGAAVAALAAALGDLFVESLSNHGAFGPGRFTDGSNADIAPIGIAGSALLLGCLFFHVRRALARDAAAQYRRELTAALAPLTIARMLPLIFLLQIVLLWTMETAEQYVVVGHGFGGTIWLGGPTVASLLLHAMICSIVTFVTRRLLFVLEPRAVRLIRRLLTSTAFPPDAAVATAWTPSLPGSPRRSLLTEVAKRGPPAALRCT
jgi:branched-subunit amino acid transport protein